MKRITRLFFISLLLSLMTAPALQAGFIAPELQSTLQSLSPDDEVSVIITLYEKANIRLFKEKNKSRRRSRITKALKRKAELTQGPLKTFLKERRGGAKRMRTLWVLNGLAVTARTDVIYELASWPVIESIRLDDTLSAPEITFTMSAEPEWNIEAIRAPELWYLGHFGQGIVMASMDTGVDIDHPDLNGKWRGGDNSWFDPNGEHDTPYDNNGHGTAIMGVLVGGSAGGTNIGVAPDAEWIAVKIFDDEDKASISGIHLGFQWLLDPDGDPETDDAPDVVNNSWGFSWSNYCNEEFQTDIEALKAAGIAVVFSAGNKGPGPETSTSPANNPESFAVGAVDDTLTIADFSSRGPLPFECDDGSIYPEVVAPGDAFPSGIKTSALTSEGLFPDSYTYVSGTSIAAPHVTGAMALLMSAFPDVTVLELESALKDSALDLGDLGPDHEYGYGQIDVAEAYNLLLNPIPASAVTLSAIPVSPQGVGTPILFTAAGEGGTGTYEYKFILKSPATDYVNEVVKDYDVPGNTWTWNPTSADIGTSIIVVKVRNAGSTALMEAKTSMEYVISPPPASDVTLSAVPGSPQGVGTAILFTATGEGGTGTYEYKFILKSPATDYVNEVVKDYDVPGNTWIWYPTSGDIGTSIIVVKVRNAGSPDPMEAKTSMEYVISTPASGVTLSAVPVSPQGVGTPILFTGEAEGGTGTYEYKFILKSPATGYVNEVVKDYDVPGNTWIWYPTSGDIGTSIIVVKVRNAGSTDPMEAKTSKEYVISTPASGVTLSAVPVSPQGVGTPILFTATGEGGTGTYEYKLILKSPATVYVNEVVKDYDVPGNTWIWYPTSGDIGTSIIVVKVRNAGSTAPMEAKTSMEYVIN